MAGRAAVDSKYSHANFRAPFTVQTGQQSIAADLLANAFGGSQALWASFFKANYPKINDDALWYISTGANASGLTCVAVTGITFATEAIPANSRSGASFLNDLSQVILSTANATIVIEG